MHVVCDIITPEYVYQEYAYGKYIHNVMHSTREGIRIQDTFPGYTYSIYVYKQKKQPNLGRYQQQRNDCGCTNKPVSVGKT